MVLKERDNSLPMNQTQREGVPFKQLLQNDAFSQDIDQGARADILYVHTLFICSWQTLEALHAKKKHILSSKSLKQYTVFFLM